MRLKNPGIRLGLACLVAASAGLSLAIISISKILLVIAVLPILLLGKKPTVDAVMLDWRKMDTPIARAGQSVLVALVISCLVNSSLYDVYIGDFFCLSLGVLLVYGARGRATPQLQES